MPKVVNILRRNFVNLSSSPVFLNRRDLKTFLPGLGTLDKLKICQKLQWNKAFLE